ncbi:MAG: bifunctional glutamate N-acetyltransferase/amino-acid acetyltransferase ArgJ [Terriglobales bacterium]
MKIHIPEGFFFAAASAGIKASGRPDLAYAEAAGGANAAVLFTRNSVVGAPIDVMRASLKRSGGRVRALIVNSGNANCATGAPGRKACERVCKETAALMKVRPAEVFASSTGIIGVPLPVDKILKALPSLVERKSAEEHAVRQFAQAIMTTDTQPKIASTRFLVGGRAISVLGVAKGAGMIHPNLATMLVYLFTDIGARPGELRPLLKRVCDETFNCISIDHDTSTNDTVLLLAGGASGVALGRVSRDFNDALRLVCASLAEQIVSDGEGVAHVARLHVEGARDRKEALTIAKAIAGSMLVKTALAGSDPNWGRILAAVGHSGVEVDPARVNIFIGPQQVCRHGQAHAFDEVAAHHYLSQPSYDIRVQLGRGKAAIDFLTSDLTAEYVRINADYST